MQLAIVSLFYHPSGDHMDPSPDLVRRFYVVSEVALDNDTILSKVADQIKLAPPYKHEVDSINCPNITCEQVVLLLKLAEFKVIE